MRYIAENLETKKQFRLPYQPSFYSHSLLKLFLHSREKMMFTYLGIRKTKLSNSKLSSTKVGY